MRSDRDWDVFLIGGGGAVGKTHVASRIAAGVAAASMMQTDDVRLVLQRAIPAAANPPLHFFLAADILSLDVRDAVDGQLEVGRFVSDMLEIVIRHHVSTARPVVVEGDAILPSVATLERHAGLATAGRVRGVFIEEVDPEHVYGALRERGRGSDSADERRWWAAFHHEHGRVLANLARTVGVPVVPARPRRDLATRIKRAAHISN